MRCSKNRWRSPSTRKPHKNLQVIDSYGFFAPATLTGILLDPSIHAACGAPETGCQQSYPQNPGMTWQHLAESAARMILPVPTRTPGCADLKIPQVLRRPSDLGEKRPLKCCSKARNSLGCAHRQRLLEKFNRAPPTTTLIFRRLASA